MLNQHQLIPLLFRSLATFASARTSQLHVEDIQLSHQPEWSVHRLGCLIIMGSIKVQVTALQNTAGGVSLLLQNAIPLW